MKNISVREMVLAALFAGLMVVGAKVSIPTPFDVKVTLQLFIVFYAGLLLGAKVALLSQIVYVLTGLIGFPVFSGETAGLEYLAKPTFGYLIGFILAAFIIGYLAQQMKQLKLLPILMCVSVGYIVAYVFGIGYHFFATNIIIGKELPLATIIGFMIPFMVKDFVLMVLAGVTALQIIPILKRAGISRRAKTV